MMKDQGRKHPGHATVQACVPSLVCSPSLLADGAIQGIYLYSQWDPVSGILKINYLGERGHTYIMHTTQGHLPFILRILATVYNWIIMAGHCNLQNWTFGCMEVDLDWTLIGQRYKMSQKYIHTAYTCSHL